MTTLIQAPSTLPPKGRIKFIAQTEPADCGLACIAMLSSCFTQPLTLHQLKEQFGSSPRGTSMLEIHDILGYLGYGVRGVQFDLDEIVEVRTPAILHWDNIHFVVLEKATHKDITILDPAIGRIQLPLSEVKSKISGAAIEVLSAPAEAFIKSSIKEERGPSLLRLVITNKQIWPTLALLSVCNLFFQILALTEPYLLSLVTDHAIDKQDKSALELIIYIFAGFFLSKTILDFVNAVIQANLSFSLSASLYASIYKHVMSLPPLFFAKRGAIDIFSRISTLETAPGFFTSGVFSAPFGLLFIIFALILTFYMAPLPALVALLFILLTIVLEVPMQLYLEKKQLAVTMIGIEESNLLAGSLMRMDQTKLNSSESGVLSRMYKKHIERSVQQRSLAIATDSLENISTAVGGLQNLVLVTMTALLCIEGKLTIGLAIAFLSLTSDVKGRLLGLIQMWSSYRSVHVQLGRLHDICVNTPEFNNTPKRSFGSLDTPPSISLQNVGFNYTKFGESILQDVNLTIEPNEKILIVGESGSGKSTLTRILTTLFPPTTGELRFNQQLSTDIDLRQVRKMFGGVLAEDKLQEGTVLSNLTSGASGYTQAELDTVLDKVGLRTTIEQMESGLSTLITGDGRGVSTGQAQRILLAAAFLRKPKILCLDEPTSHCDSEVSRRIGESLLSYPGTVIICTHDKSLLDLPYRKIYINAGRVSEKTS
jgi:ATP-binding cassette, subfamily B, bacterial CvaB/MchF/RaxB